MEKSVAKGTLTSRALKQTEGYYIVERIFKVDKVDPTIVIGKVVDKKTLKVKLKV
jgi:hypothetical protein